MVPSIYEKTFLDFDILYYDFSRNKLSLTHCGWETSVRFHFDINNKTLKIVILSLLMPASSTHAPYNTS